MLRRNKHKKQDPEFVIRYCDSKIPKVSDLEGTYDVEMYGKWRFMNRDQKVISDGKGYNQFRIFGGFYMRWGEFEVWERPDCIYLVYRKGKTRDKLRLDRGAEGVFNGLYCKRKNDKDVIISVFRLIKRHEEDGNETNKIQGA